MKSNGFWEKYVTISQPKERHWFLKHLVYSLHCLPLDNLGSYPNFATCFLRSNY